ncbi:hypothetical protein SR1949_31330 [Sphaerospermopsis reniformis]|uniref:Uncharacterized protein n=1 Tax=Sphaerospermopsis reniformis TaxID=531300 RepID=A0A479ZYZ5_9CYAN|nr:hypothetical protein [Sphaerospermopsis reniformis]GCL38020.1 hypothetical protein SR1949_31330 [Sphaerospermopsis reniformis]
MQVINNNELFTQVAAEESAIASGGKSDYQNNKYMPDPYYGNGWNYGNGWKTSAPETAATYLPLLKATGLIQVAEAFGIANSAMQLEVIKILAGL